MARFTLRQLLDHAAEPDYGVLVFNISNMDRELLQVTSARWQLPAFLTSTRRYHRQRRRGGACRAAFQSSANLESRGGAVVGREMRMNPMAINAPTCWLAASATWIRRTTGRIK